MDLVLDICDEYALDKIWAHLVPFSAFAAESSLPTNQGLVNTSKWTDFVSLLPRPQLPVESASPFDFTPAPVTFVSAWPRDYVPRQLISLTLLTLVGIHAMYFIFAGLSYKYIFNRNMMRHPRFLKNQVKLEIQSSLKVFPTITLLMLPWFQAEVMGYSKLYKNVDKYGWLYLFVSIPLYVSYSFYNLTRKLTSFRPF